MFIPRYTKQYIDFVDNDGLTRYYDTDIKYIPCPHIIEDIFTIHYKTFYKTRNGYFLGIQNESFVRSIPAKDFHDAKKVFVEKELAFKEFFALKNTKTNNKPYVQGVLPLLD